MLGSALGFGGPSNGTQCHGMPRYDTVRCVLRLGGARRGKARSGLVCIADRSGGLSYGAVRPKARYGGDWSALLWQSLVVSGLYLGAAGSAIEGSG